MDALNQSTVNNMRGQTDDNDDETSHTGCTNIQRSIVAAFQRLCHSCLDNGANQETVNRASGSTSRQTPDHTSRQTPDHTIQHSNCSISDDKIPTPVEPVIAAGTKTESASTIITYNNSKVSKNIHRTPSSSRVGHLRKSTSCNQLSWITEKERPILDAYCWYPKQWKHNLVDINKTDSDKQFADAGNDSMDAADHDHDVINDVSDRVPFHGSDIRFMRMELRRRALTMSAIQSMNPQREDGRLLRAGGSTQDQGTSQDRIRRYIPRISDLDAVCSIQCTVIPSTDERDQRGRLILTIETKGKFIKKKTTAKPLKSGTGMIVTLVPNLRYTNKKCGTPLIKMMPLPWTINPLNIKTSVEADGILTIRAHIVRL